MFKAV